MYVYNTKVSTKIRHNKIKYTHKPKLNILTLNCRTTAEAAWGAGTGAVSRADTGTGIGSNTGVEVIEGGWAETTESP